MWKLSSSLFLFLLIIFTGSLLPIISVSSMSDNVTTHFSNMCSNLLILGCVLTIVKVKKAFGNGYLSKKYWVSILLTPVISILLVIKLIDSIILNDYPYIFPIAVILLLIINILLFLLCDYIIVLHNEKLLKRRFEKQNIYYLNQYNIMEKIQEENKKIQHDIKNVLIGYSGTNKDLVDLNRWINPVENNSIVLTGNSTIDSILNYKKNIAKNMDIDLILDLKIPHDINLEILTMSVILGNLMDNALESCNLNLNQNHRKIFVKINYHNNNLYIKIKNHYTHNLNKKSETTFYSTKNDKKNRGIGLENVKQIIKNVNGLITFSTENNVFCVKVILYDV